MKTISNELKREIEDASAEGLILLPAEVIEKDIHVTDALKVVAETLVKTTFNLSGAQRGDPRPKTIDVGSTPVFAGGTCLSKAHGLIERMSEDIDIKVMLEAVPDGYVRKNGGSDKARLTELHNAVYKALCDVGFAASEVEEVEALPGESEDQERKNPHIRDGRRYFHLSLNYESVFSRTATALRPQIKLELIHRPTASPAVVMSMGYLFDKLIDRESSTTVNIACISVGETLAEKVLSMLRRCAWKWYGGQRSEIDSTLVRHIYDVGQIVKKMPEALQAAAELFPQLVSKDAEEFGRQYPDFVTNSQEILLQALAQLERDEEQISNYNVKLIPLIYTDNVPSYEEAFAVFKSTAEKLIGTLQRELDTPEAA